MFIHYSAESHLDAQAWRVIAGLASLVDGVISIVTLGLFASYLTERALHRVMHHRLRRRK